MSQKNLTGIGDIPFNSFASNLAGFRVSNNYVTVIAEKEIWIGSGSAEAERVYIHEAANSSIRVISPAISRGGEVVAFAVTNANKTSASLWILDVSSGAAEKVADEITRGPFAWSSNNAKIFLGTTVVGSSDSQIMPMVFDVETRTSSRIFDIQSTNGLGAYDVSADGSKSVSIRATVDESKPDSASFTGYYIGKPFQVVIGEPGSSQEQVIATLDIDSSPSSIAFNQAGTKVYWSEASKLMEYDTSTGSTTNIYETTAENIDVVYAVADGKALIGSQLPDRTYAVYSVDLAAKDRVKVMETTDSTSAIGLLIN